MVFFIRDDVPADFAVTHEEGLNKNLPEPPPPVDFHIGSGKPLWVETIESGFIGPELKKKPMSQDQAYGLMIGMALVSKLVPEAANFQGNLFQDGEEYFVLEARAITDRMIKTMQFSTHLDQMNFDVIVPDWIIHDPAGSKVDRGHTCWPYSFGIAKAGEKIVQNPVISATYFDIVSTNASQIWQLLQVWNFVISVCESGEFVSDLQAVAAIVNNLYAINNVGITVTAEPLDCNDFTLRQSLELAAIGDSWRSLTNPLINTTQLSILAQSSFFDWGSFYSLLRQILHGGVYAFQNSTTEGQLNSALCDGPFNHSATDKAGSGWAFTRRFAGDLDEQANGTASAGNFPGLDYMLLHNMYYIHRLNQNGLDSEGNSLPFYENFMDRFINVDFPIGNIGNQANPITLGTFRSITADNTINSDGDVSYRAGEVITLLPDFEAVAGSKFHAFIDPFECVNDQYQKTADSTGGLYGMGNFSLGTNNYVPLSYEEKETYIEPQEESTSTLPEPSAVRIYPNPHAGQFTIEFSGEEAYLILTDMMGKVVWQEKKLTGNRHNIDISHQPKGIYFIRVQQGDQIFTEKLIHQ